jgi:hypothetical protein
MNTHPHPLPESLHRMLDETPEPEKVAVSVLDRNNRTLATGRAVLPLLLGVGIFWPSGPLPLTLAERLSLGSGETLKVDHFILCEGLPLHYEFWVSSPFSAMA